MSIKYYPFLRAKTYDVKAVAGCAKSLVQNGKIMPIFEPVSDPSTTLLKSAKAFGSVGLEVAVVVNPQVGALIGSLAKTTKLLSDMIAAKASVVPAFSVTPTTQVAEAHWFLTQFPGRSVCVHFGVPNAQVTSLLLRSQATHVFLSGATNTAHQHSFLAAQRALLSDGFKAQAKNAAYPAQSFFGDLHLTYPTLGFAGFGDFAIVGYRFSPSGGPAYAVAIHMTEDFQAAGIFCNHFLSTSNFTPADPAGKFCESLAALSAYCQQHPG